MLFFKYLLMGLTAYGGQFSSCSCRQHLWDPGIMRQGSSSFFFKATLREYGAGIIYFYTHISILCFIFLSPPTYMYVQKVFASLVSALL